MKYMYDDWIRACYSNVLFNVPIGWFTVFGYFLIIPNFLNMKFLHMRRKSRKPGILIYYGYRYLILGQSKCKFTVFTNCW